MGVDSTNILDVAPQFVEEAVSLAMPELNQWPARSISVRFVVINDLHMSAEHTRDLEGITALWNREKPDFAIYLGDLNQRQSPDACTLEATYRALLDATSHAEFPCHFGMGNTDMARDGDPTGPFRAQMKTPPYYSFDFGGAHFAMLYTEKETPQRFGWVADEQLQWLNEDLMSIDPGTPIVLFGHHALFDDARQWDKDNWAIDNSRALLDSLRSHRLIATFSGHRHLNRICIDERGVPHIINGPLYGDHSDDAGAGKGGVGYRWVTIAGTQLSTSWVRVDPM